MLVMVAMCIAAFFPASGLTVFPIHFWELSTPTLHKDQKSIDNITSIIGDAPIAAQANIGMFFSQRNAIYPFPHMLEKSEFIVLHLQHPFADNSRSNFNIPYGTDTEIFVKNVADTLQKPDWNIVYWQKPWLVLKRGTRVANTHRDAEIEQELKALTSAPTP